MRSRLSHCSYGIFLNLAFLQVNQIKLDQIRLNRNALVYGRSETNDCMTQYGSSIVNEATAHFIMWERIPALL